MILSCSKATFYFLQTYSLIRHSTSIMTLGATYASQDRSHDREKNLFCHCKTAQLIMTPSTYTCQVVSTAFGVQRLGILRTTEITWSICHGNMLSKVLDSMGSNQPSAKVIRCKLKLQLQAVQHCMTQQLGHETQCERIR